MHLSVLYNLSKSARSAQRLLFIVSIQVQERAFIRIANELQHRLKGQG